MKTLSINQKILISALIGFVIGASAVLVWNVSQKQSTSNEKKIVAEVDNNESNDVKTLNNQQMQETSVAPVLVGEKDRVDVDDQRAGSAVNVLVIELGNPGWVAIQEDHDGELGNVLGAAWFPQGTSQGSVELLRDTIPGNTYHVVLYNDNGNKAFELGVDAMIVDSQQNPV